MDRRVFLGGAAMASMGLASSGETAPQLAVKVEDEDLYVRYGERPLLRYRRKTVPAPEGTNPLLAANGYLHPVHAPNGAVVTDHLSPDHRHQRGVFSAWTKTRLTLGGETLTPDFWNIHQGSGRVRSEGVEPLTEGGRAVGFRARHVSEARVGDRWEAALEEGWEVRFPSQRAEDPAAPKAAYVFDISSRQTPRVAVELPKYHYGGMAVRGARPWGKGSDVSVLTSEGADRAGADQKPARWIDMSGTVEGRVAGIALLEHPANLHAPNGVRMHDGMPYYVFALPQAGPITLEAGKSYVFRYRVVAHNGRADRELLEELWRDFAGSG